MKVALIALGCEKNIINSEQMLYLLDKDADITITADVAEADITVINTCGFIEAAREEAIEQILEASALCKKIIVAGCMTEKHSTSISREMPEVAGLVGAGRFDDICAAVKEVWEGRGCLYLGKLDEPVSETPRIVTSAAYTAYLKIAEGCDNHCTYCAIPSLRGRFRSRSEDAIMAEAEGLVKDGVRELCLIAQDTTRYGADLCGKPALAALLKRLCTIEGLDWLRLHYLHPALLDDSVIDCIASEPKIVKYLDIPMQHASDAILAAMNRRTTERELRELVQTLRRRIPGVAIRTTMMTGFPGETEEDFTKLCHFVRDMRLERVGVFAFSQEEGTPAANLPRQLPEALKRDRADRLEMIASDNMDSFHQSRIGGEEPILCEGFDRFAGIYYGRSYADAPEVDGKVFFSSHEKPKPGDMITVRFTEVVEGDLFAEAIDNFREKGS